MHGCIRNEVAKDSAVLLHVKHVVTETYNLRRLYKTSRATRGTTVSPWLRSQGIQESPTDRFLVYHSENDVAMALWGGHIMARGSQEDVSWVFNRLTKQFHYEDGGYNVIHGDKFQVKSDGNYTRQPGGTPRDVTANVLKYRKQLNQSCDASELEQAAALHNCCQLDSCKYAETLDQIGDPDTQAYLYALTDHYDELEIYSTPLDSGSARHIHNAVVVTDPRAARSLMDIKGNISWTQGTGYIPVTLKDSDGQILNMDLQDADYRRARTFARTRARLRARGFSRRGCAQVRASAQRRRAN